MMNNMELDDLKKTWKSMDTELQNKQLITDDELLNIVKHKKGNAIISQKALLRNNLAIMIITLFLLAYFIFMHTGKSDSDLLFWVIISVAAICIPWSLYTMRYMKKTLIYEMPLATVISRINRYNYWMTIERITGVVLLFVIALLSIIQWKPWEINGWFQYFVYGTWAVAFIVYLVLINKLTFRRLQNIRKNLNELKEVNEKN